jgi:hypothetical protein
MVVVATAALSGPPSATGQGTTAPSILPRTLEGKPDFSGVWQAMNTAAWDIQDHSAQQGIPAGQGVVEGGELPYQPWAVARKKENFANRIVVDTESKCYLPGVPRIMYMLFPFQFVQMPTQVAILFEYAHAVRNIFVNGTMHPPGHIDFWMGDSRGQWEGDTLVVDVIHFNDETWFDKAGNFHSEALHIVERFTLMGPDHINYEVTVEDPKVFTRPWKMSMILYRHKEKNFQMLEYECYTFPDNAYYPQRR